MSCPIIEDRNSQNWKDIENKYGSYAVFEAWSKNDYSIPSLEEYENTYQENPQLTERDPKLNGTRESYEESLNIASDIIEESSQLEIRLNPETNKEEYFHKRLERFVGNRVTDKQKALYEKGKSKQQLKEQAKRENSPFNMQLKDGGTMLHDWQENILNNLIQGKTPQKPDGILEGHWEMLINQVSSIIEDARSIQETIDPSVPPLFLTETTIFEEDTDTAGTIDLLVQFSDKSAAIYDWKFRNAKFDDKGNIVHNPYIEIKKEKSWDVQLSQYSRMLSKYGIEKIRRARIIPIYVSYEAPPSMVITSLITPESKLDESVNIISVAKEYIEDEGLYKTMESLRQEKERLTIKIENYKSTERDISALDKINKAIHAILIEGELNTYISFIDDLIRERKGDLSVLDPNEEGYILNQTLINNSNLLDLFHKNLSYVYTNLKREKDKYSEEDYKNLLNKISQVRFNITTKQESVENVMKERAKILGDTAGVKGMLKPQKEMGLTTKYLTYLSDIDHPFFKVFNKLTKRSQDETRTDSEELLKKVGNQENSLRDWAKKNNMSMEQAYLKLVNTDTGLLRGKFRKELYELREALSEENKIAELYKHFQVTREDADKMLERRSKYLEYLNKEHDDQKDIDKKIAWWDSKWNVVTSPKAWTNLDNFYITPRDPDKWKSEEWKYIENNAPLLEFYQFHQNLMSEFEEMLNIPGKHLGKNFIANIQKDMIQKIFSNGMTSISNTLLNSLEIKQDDETFGNVDTDTGQTINSIPILHLNPIRNTKGEVDLNQKSYDLSRNLILFGTMAYNYRNTSEIEDSVILLEHLLKDQEQILTNAWGKPLYKDVTGTRVKTGKGSENTRSAFNSFVERYIYGRSLSSDSKEFSFTIGGKRMSSSGIVIKAMGFYSLVSLSFNAISAFAAFGGSFGNTLASGAKNVHYTNKGIALAAKELATPGKDKGRAKIIGLWDMLGISQENLVYKKANDLSAQRVNRLLTLDNAFILHRKVDDSIDLLTLGAILQNYGYDKNGKVQRFAKLPPGTKPLWDYIKIENDQLSILDPQGNPMSKDEMFRFRAIVRKVATYNKGNMSREDINLLQTQILGRLIMQFRGWIPAMAQERFRNTKYDELLDEVQFGRYRVFFGELLKSGFLPTAKEYLKIAAEIVKIYRPNGTIDTEASNFYYQKFLFDNPNSNATKEEFLVARKAQMRAFVSELGMYMVILPMLAAAFAWGDDDDEKGADYYALKKVARVMNRTSMELGFFFNPKEGERLIRSPIPLTGFVIDIMNLTEDVVTLDKNTGKSLLKITPGGKGLFQSILPE